MTADVNGTRILSGRSLLTLFFCAVFMLVEGMDLASLPLAVPWISREWGLAPSEFALSLSAIVVGIGFAAVAIAPFGEKIGRRRMIFWSGLLAAAASGATAWSHNLTAFVFWRLLTGIGLGACLPNVTASVVQIAPVQVRSRVLAIVNTAIPVGAVLAGLLVAPLVRIGTWQTMFYLIAAISVLCSVALRILLPTDERSSAIARTEEARPGGSPILLLLRREHLVKTLLLLGLGSANTFLIYMMINWLPTLLPRAGMSLAEAARMSSLFQLGGIGGGFCFAYLIDRGRPVTAFVLGYALATAALVAMAALDTAGPSWIGLLLAAGVGISGAHVAITLFGVMFYPQHLLSSYVGLSIAVTRIGAIGGPLAGGWLLAVDTGITSYLLGAILAVAVCLVWVLAIGYFCAPPRPGPTRLHPEAGPGEGDRAASAIP